MFVSPTAIQSNSIKSFFASTGKKAPQYLQSVREDMEIGLRQIVVFIQAAPLASWHPRGDAQRTRGKSMKPHKIAKDRDKKRE